MRLAWALGLASMLSIAACHSAPERAMAPAGLEDRLEQADPLHPDFEARLRSGQSLFDCLVSVDTFIYPGLDEAQVRNTFESLSAQARPVLERIARARRRSATAEDAACAFLRTLSDQGYTCGSVRVDPGSPDAKTVSGTLLHRTGCCGSFSLLVMAYLDRMGRSSSIVCLPGHCFVRLGGADAEIEATDFDTPLRQDYLKSPDLTGLAAEGGHYGRSLGAHETLWHYYVDRLWSWNSWRVTDAFCLRALAGARAVLGSSCLSIESQEALRYFRIAKNPQEAPDRKAHAWTQSFERYAKLSRSHPGQADYATALGELEAMPRPAGTEALTLLQMAGESTR